MSHFWMKISLGVVVATAIGSAAVLAYLPERLPMHWNIDGEVDGWGSRPLVVWLMPAVMAGLLGLFLALPWLSPQKFSLDTFRETFEFIVFLVLALCAYIHAVTLYAGWSNRLNVASAIVGGICLMFTALGNVLGKVKRNFYVGVRTPWTLANDRVWNSTHRLAARLFFAAGLLGMIACLLLSMKWSVIVLAGVIGVAALVPVFYSLVLYKRLEKRGEA